MLGALLSALRTLDEGRFDSGWVDHIRWGARTAIGIVSLHLVNRSHDGFEKVDGANPGKERWRPSDLPGMAPLRV
jgi:hypothetical protein